MAEEGTNDDGTADEGTGAGGAGESGRTFTQAELDRIVADRVARERGKYADYGDLKRKAAAAMTDQERLVSEAEQRGRTAASTAAATRLARAELRAAAAENHVPKDALDSFLEYAALDRFVGADGEPDSKAIEAAVKRLGGSAASTNFDGGARTNAAKPTDMNQQIRLLSGHG